MNTYLGDFRQRHIDVQHALEEVLEHVFLRAPHVLGHYALDDAVLCEDEGLALVVAECIANGDDYWSEFVVFVGLVEMYSMLCNYASACLTHVIILVGETYLAPRTLCGSTARCQ
jgi:hypothetical protein